MAEITNEDDWNKLVNHFIRNAELFVSKVEKVDDGLLDRPMVKEKYRSYIKNIEGVIEHSYYHLGQVLLLCKLILQQ